MIYRFGNCLLDTEQHELRREDEIVDVEPRVYEVLLYLIKHRSQVVTRDELLEHCWPGMYISDGTLSRCISRVRQAIGQKRSGEQLIQTLHARGYRFIGTVTEQQKPSEVTGSGGTDETGQVLQPAPSTQDSVRQVVRRTDIDSAAAVGDETDTMGAARTGTDAANTDSTVLLRPVPPSPERRQITVMSCLLADADRFFAENDAEELHLLIETFQQAYLDVIDPLEGYIAQRMQTGFIAYFGYPRAHEDDARRAVFAGLELVSALAARSLEVRIGIHTDIVIMDPAKKPGTKPLAIGVCAQIAAGLNGQAPPSSILVGSATARLIEGYFEYQTWGEHSFRGKTQAIYQIKGESKKQTLFDDSSQKLSPFISREAEIALLQQRWHQAMEGFGQMVLLSGDAGIGKSRLIHVFRQQLVIPDTDVLLWRAFFYHRNTALYPVTERLRRSIGWRLEQSAEKRRPLLQNLENLLKRYGLPADECIPLFARLLMLPEPDQQQYPQQLLSPEAQQKQTLEILLRLLLAQISERPVLLIVEDIHWADSLTLELLELIIAQTPTLPIMVLMTARSGFRPPWDFHTRITPMTLNRLSREEALQMVTGIAGERTLTAQMEHALLEKADGVPLFVEELARMALEDEQQTTSIPITLQNALVSRLDLLTFGKDIAQFAAVLGREFQHRHLAAIVPFDAPSLDKGLHELIDAEIIYKRGLTPDISYVFKHALIRDVAYQSLLKRQRQSLHQHIAEVLIDRFADDLENNPLLAEQHIQAAAGDSL